MITYYYVFNSGRHAPSYKHATLESAEKEAKRLAEKHCGESIEILMCVGIASTPKPKATTFWMDGVKARDSEP